MLLPKNFCFKECHASCNIINRISKLFHLTHYIELCLSDYDPL